MWSQLALCLFVGLAYASNPGWQDNVEYVYKVRGRTLASLHEISDQYSGIMLKAILRIQPKPDGKLLAQLSDSHYSQVHTHLQEWTRHIPDAELSWKPLQLSQRPFQVEMKSGVITNVVVNQDISNWEANLIKSVLSQFQLNTNEASKGSSGHPDSGVYTTLEDTVTGYVDTLYKINPLPEYLVISEPWGEQAIEYKKDGQVIEVVRHKNYSNSIELPSYSFGFGGTMEEDFPGTNSIGELFVRDSISRAILCGSLKKYVLHHSYTVNRIMANPTLQDKEKGSVQSLMNVTLQSIKDVSQPLDSVQQPVRLGNLVYTYGSPFANQDRVQDNKFEPHHQALIENNPRYRRPMRMRRSVYSENSDSSESEESYKKEQPKIEEAPESPLLPLTVGYGGLSIKKATDVPSAVKTLVQEIGQDLQEENKNLQETLSKTTTLSTLMKLLNAQEMQHVAEELYSNEKEGLKRDSWQVYRDCVAECGTGPALLTIQNWIQSKKIKDFEAAWILMSMIRAVRQPTPQYMKAVFELIKSPQVQSAMIVNASAVLSYTDLVYKVYVDRDYSRAQYPIKSFKNFNNKEGRRLLIEAIIPYYTQQLHQAISHAETAKIHVYTRALGNIGHPDILRAFQPYLEGQKQASQFQRFNMILSLDKLAEVNPEETRKILFRVYQNVGETEEIRVAAVLRLIRSRPPTEMLQYMASYTNIDAHEHVSAAVKQTIEEMSELSGPQYYHLRVAAEAAKPLLTKREYGLQYGAQYIQSFYSDELDYAVDQQTILVGSSDSYVPKGIKASLSFNAKGKREHFWLAGGLVSSIDELVHVLKQQTAEYTKNQEHQKQSFDQQKQNKQSSQYIASVLNLDRREREQLEGFLYGGFKQSLQMISFDNKTMEKAVKEFEKFEQELRKGQKINFVKLVNRSPLALSFPTEMGIPFLFTYDTPTILKVKGAVKATANPQLVQENKIQKPEKVEIETDVTITISGKYQGQLSFVTPYDHHQYVAGYHKHLQVYVPITARVEVDLKQQQARAELEPCKKQPESTLVQYSTQPFTSIVDITNFQPISAQPNTHPIEQSNLRLYDNVHGQLYAGLALHVKLQHERQFMDTSKIQRRFWEEGFLAALKELWNDAEIQQSQIKVTHIPGQSSTQKVVVNYGQQEEYYQHGDASDQSSQFSQLKDSKERQQKAMKSAASGINSVRSQVYDGSIEFQGTQLIKYQLTGAFAKSNVDPKSRVLVQFTKQSDKQASKPYYVSLAAKNEVPNVNGLDLEYAMQTEPKVDSHIELAFGENHQSSSKVVANIKFSRSQERKQYLNEQPFFRQCQEDQRQGNKQSVPCLNMTVEANFLDRMNVEVHGENLSEESKETLKALYSGLKLQSFPSVEVDHHDKSGNQNELDFKAAFDPDLRSVNISLKSPQETIVFRNVYLSSWTSHIVVPHPVYHLKNRVLNNILGITAARGTCVVDRSQIKTFNNRTLPTEVSKQWTVMVQYIPEDARHEESQHSMEYHMRNQVEHFAVLVRQNPQSNDKKDIKFTFSNPSSEFKVVEITMTPERSGNAKAKVEVNGKQVQVSNKQSYDIGKDAVQIYALPNGEIKLELKHAFYAIYDGERIRIVPTSGKLQDANRGICGQNTNNQFEDLVTPSDCYAHDENKFVKSYEVEGQEGGSVRKEFAKDEKQCAHKHVPLYSKVIGSNDMYSSHEGCSLFQTSYVEHGNEICFTTRSIPVCRSGCRPQGAVTRDIPVHCLPASQVTDHWKEQIDNGKSPDFSHKKETGFKTMQLPNTCTK